MVKTRVKAPEMTFMITVIVCVCVGCACIAYKGITLMDCNMHCWSPGGSIYGKRHWGQKPIVRMHWETIGSKIKIK